MTCSGCSAPVFESDHNVRRNKASRFCPNCSNNIPVLIQSLIAEVKQRVAFYKFKKKKHFDQVSSNLFIVEDEQGQLMTCQGDLSFLMASAPTINMELVPQLSEYIREAYEAMQLAVWDLDREECPPLFTKCKRQVVMFPIYIFKERFTVSVFTHPSV